MENDIISSMRAEAERIDALDDKRLAEVIAEEKPRYREDPVSRFRLVCSLIKLDMLDEASFYLADGTNITEMREAVAELNGELLRQGYVSGEEKESRGVCGRLSEKYSVGRLMLRGLVYAGVLAESVSVCLNAEDASNEFLCGFCCPCAAPFACTSGFSKLFCFGYDCIREPCFLC